MELARSLAGYVLRERTAEMAAPTGARTCVVCSEPSSTPGAWPECAQGHTLSLDCFSAYIVHTWSTRDHGVGVVPELTCCETGCTAAPFTAQAVAKFASPEAWTAYDEVRKRAIEAHAIADVQRRLQEGRPTTAAPGADAAVRQAEEEAQERLLLGEQLRRQVTNARMCPRCLFGPMDHGWCSDLAMHHGEVRNGATINNSCPQCGFFTASETGWPRWDGIIRAPQPVGRAPQPTVPQPVGRALQPSAVRTARLPLRVPPPTVRPPQPTIRPPQPANTAPVSADQLALIMQITHCTEAQALIALESAHDIHGEDEEHIVDAAVGIIFQLAGDEPAAPPAADVQAAPVESSWRFVVEGDDLFCDRRGLRIRLWQRANGWFDCTHSGRKRTVFSSSSSVQDNRVSPANRAPPDSGRREFPETFGEWTLLRAGSTIEVRNRQRPLNVLLLNEEGWNFSEEGPPRTTATATTRVPSFTWPQREPVTTPIAANLSPVISAETSTTPTPWRFRVSLGFLECCRRRLRICLPLTNCNGYFEMQNNDEPMTMCWSMNPASITIVSGNMAAVTDEGFSANFPCRAGDWTLQNLGQRTMARCRDGGRVLFFLQNGFEGLRETDSPAPGEELAAASATEDTGEEHLWRFRMRTNGLECARRGLTVELPSGCNGWFQMQLNGETQSRVVYSAENAGINIARLNRPPVAGTDYSDTMPETAGVWELRRFGNAFAARCTNSSGRVLLFKRDRFVYLKEAESPESWDHVRGMLVADSPEESTEQYLTSTPWRFEQENGELRMLRRRLEVMIRPDLGDFYVKANDDPRRLVPAHEASGIVLSLLNRAPVSGVPGAVEAFPARFGSWELERIGYDIFLRNTQSNRTLALGPHEFLYSNTEQTVQLPTDFARDEEGTRCATQ